MTVTYEQGQAFFEGIAPGVIADAVKKKVLPSLTLAQAALESAYGASDLAKLHNNYFGIKGSGSAGSVSYPTTEYDQYGHPRQVNADFAAYASVEDGIAAHTDLFLHGVSWDQELYKPVLASMTSDEACDAVQACGYATDPNYASMLKAIVSEYGLTGYDDQYHKLVDAGKDQASTDLPQTAPEAAPAPQPVEQPQPQPEHIIAVQNGDTVHTVGVDEFNEALAWAEAAGIVQGNGTGDFGADSPLTRGQFVVVLKRLHDRGYFSK